MSFSHGWVLMFLVIPVGLMVYEISRGLGRSGRVRLPFDEGSERVLRPRRTKWLTYGLTVGQVVPMVLMGVTIVILAGPRRLAEPKQERLAKNIEIVLDVSGSMMSPIVGSEAALAAGLKLDEEKGTPTRYTAAMWAIREFCERRKGDAFGLTIFGSEVIRWMPLTRDLAAIRDAGPFVNPARMPPGMGGTRIGYALNFVKDVLARQPEGDRLVILITDGISSDLGGRASAEIAGKLAAEGIVVHAVCIGEDGSGDGARQLAGVAVPTGGKVFTATSAMSLQGVFEHIDRMQKTKFRDGAREEIDDFRFLALAGLVLLGLHSVCLLGWRWQPW